MTRSLSVEAARARMLAGVGPGPADRVALDRHAVNRILAQPIRAVRDQPPFDASAMDGYAVRIGEAAPPGGFRVVGESAAGRGYPGELGVGEAIRIFTGAPVPAGCAVVVQEQAQRAGERVRFAGPTPQTAGHVRPRGGDFHAGQVLLQAGVRLDPWRLALAAAAGRHEAEVAARPRVAVLSTGEEIVRAGAGAPSPFQVFDSGGPALSALAAGWGADPMPLEPAGDDERAIAAAVEGVAADLLVVVGGASVGDYDLVKPALRRLGLRLEVESVNLRPGKPTWFGVLADGRRVLGLPGNPASALVAAELFLRPLLCAWQGADACLRMETARLSRALPATGAREHWMRATLDPGLDGVQRATPFPDQDSSLVSVFASADALLRRPAGGAAAPAGAAVEVLRLGRLTPSSVAASSGSRAGRRR